MEKSFSKIKSAALLPVEWDNLSENYFQKRAFLAHAEKYNPCRQRYYILYTQGKIAACACVYTLVLDLLTFIKIKSPVKMKVVGIPATISPAGIFGNYKYIKLLLEHIFCEEKGLILGMNLPPKLECTPAVSMRTMPTIVFQNNFKGYDHYLSRLRSDYRRRVKVISSAFENITTLTGDCSRFDSQYHDLYLQIMNRSKTPLEVLTRDFFKNLPAEFRLTSYHRQETILAWHITISDGPVFYFFFGGTNYTFNKKYHSYFNNLLGILKEFYKSNSEVIDFGQTADIPKMKLGGNPEELILFLYHRNSLVNKALKLSRSLLRYKKKPPVFHVFKT